MLQNIVSKIRLPWLFFTLAVAAILLNLSHWQYERSIEKKIREQKISQYQQQQPASVVKVQQLMADDFDVNDLPMQVTGHFDNEHAYLLDNQTLEGRVGYRVLKVLVSENVRVLVNLGWVAAPKYRDQLPKIDAIDGQHTIRGHIRIIEQNITLANETQHNQWPMRIQQIDLDKISSLIGQKLLPFVLYLDKKEVLGYQKNWQPIVMPWQKHQAYAVQWFALAIAWLSLMCWAAFRHNNKKR
ncbi:SURF1 family protein [Thalassotalea agarivorans]|uniref:SURF1-like protein n=1 Tax=Thalassotalea agarivorans TaxID=349064 RepID=A0A1I0HNU3_THASX|nr:SURF1 family protein [Thalassotalea agarivorans]SET85635.1 surfeit locus 1 family protein [Thalassotalea agarivorans]